MEHSKLSFALTVIISLTIGFASGYCIGFFPIQKESEIYQHNFEYYRDKYLNECEIYEKIIDVASRQQIDDFSKLYYIRSTYLKAGRSQEIEEAIRLKKSLERK